MPKVDNDCGLAMIEADMFCYLSFQRVDSLNAVNREIGRLIRKAREHLNYPIEVVAEELGIAEDRLLQYERGDARPAPFQLLAICALLRVQPSWFFPEIWSAEGPQLGKAPLEVADKAPDGDQISATQSPGTIEVSFPGGIRVLVGREFDERVFRRLVAVLKTT